MTEEKKGVSGTKEWSVASVNCAKGCPHGCWYCYGRADAMRFKRIDSHDDWRRPEIKRKLAQERKKYDGTVMFPTTHDITPDLLQPAYEVLLNLLQADNDVLIVSKPHLHCVQVLCAALDRWRDQILWRFTIGCLDGEKTLLWEPYAPPPVERIACLEHARRMGYETSVSMEPMLDPANIMHDYPIIARHATQSVWLGKMNMVRHRVPIREVKKGIEVKPGMPLKAVERLEAAQTDAQIKLIYKQLKDEPKVRWKESIKKVVGIPLETEAGTDK